MVEFLSKHWPYLLVALFVHALFAGIFGLAMLNLTRTPPQVQPAIEAVLVDQSVLNRLARQRQRERQRERERIEDQRRQQEVEAEKRQQQETEQREAEQRAEQEREEAEQRRLTEEKQQRERLEADRKREAEAAKQRQAEVERKRVAEIERKQKEEAERRRAAEEAKAQAARENDLRNQLEEEENRSQAESSGLLNQYIALVQEDIYEQWIKPPSARAGLECEIRVEQTRTGTVLKVDLGACNGDAAVRESIVTAVNRASPLPEADPRVYQRVLLLRFKPTE
jgi:colicin import membrane protein